MQERTKEWEKEKHQENIQKVNSTFLLEINDLKKTTSTLRQQIEKAENEKLLQEARLERDVILKKAQEASDSSGPLEIVGANANPVCYCWVQV